MKYLGIVDFSQTNTSNGFPLAYTKEAFPGISFLKIFLNRIKKIKKLDHIVALVHPSLKAELEYILKEYDFIEIYELPNIDVTLHYAGQQIIIRSRKWNYKTFRGGCSETNYFDEILPMEIIKDIGTQVSTETILYLNPEQPLFDLDYTHQILEQNEHISEHNPPFLVRPTVQGLSPLLITKTGLEQLKTVNWSPRLVFTCHAGGDGVHIMKKKVESEPHDLARGSFVLRDNRDADHLKYVLDTLEKSNEPWSARNMINASASYIETKPREIDIECTKTPFPERCGLPQNLPSSDMSLELFKDLYSEICSWEDGLLSLGDLSDVLAHHDVDGLLNLLNEKKPFGLHIVLNAEKLLLEEKFHKWLQIPSDIITLRLTTLSGSLFHSISDCEVLLKQFVQFYSKNRANCPAINLELHKTERNLQDIHSTVDLAKRFGCSYNWIPHNDYCEQVETSAVIQSSPTNRYACEKILNQVYILSDGRVSSCKQDFTGKVCWGDVNNSSIIEVWNSEKWLSARKKQIEGEHEGTTPLCSKCHQWLHA